MHQPSPQLTVLGDGGPCFLFDHTWLKGSVAELMRSTKGPAMDWMQRMTPNGEAYKTFARGFHAGTGTLLLFSRDEGMHSSGWWKNPDYERCLHLSLSFYEVDRFGNPQERRSKDSRATDEWLELFFGNSRRLLWCEPPVTPEGRRADSWHYRLFVDPAWQPLKPRGEVYSREFTAAGWKSYSDVQYAKAGELLNPGERTA